MAISKKDKILIKNLWKSKGYSARMFIKEFPDKTGTEWDWIRPMCWRNQMGTVERKVYSGHWLLIWLLSSVVKDWELVWVRKEGTSNIAFELTDGVDFVNHSV